MQLRYFLETYTMHLSCAALNSYLNLGLREQRGRGSDKRVGREERGSELEGKSYNQEFPQL